jgi:hypothetical protein
MSDLITLNDLHLVFVSDYYDMPLSGICRHNGRLCEFEGDYDAGTYTIKPLAWWQKARWLQRKKLFEFCVGRHWSYGTDGREVSHFHYRSPVWFYRFLFRAYYWRNTLRRMRQAIHRTMKQHLGKK